MAFHFEPKVHCQHLRAKEMYAHEPKDPEREAAVREMYGSCEGTAFWCLLTQTARGPDGERVTKDLCGRARKCFLGIDDVR